MNTVIIIFGALLITIGFAGLFVCLNNKLFCRIYLHEEWKLWEYLYSHIDEAVYDRYVCYDNLPDLESFVFNLSLDGTDCQIIYWVKTNRCSVFVGDECLLCGFDKYHSDLIRDALMDKRIKEVTGE